MNNKNIIDIIEKVLSESDSFQDKSAKELREMLDNELSKPDNTADYSLVDELTTAIIETEGNNRLTVDVDEKLHQFNGKTKEHGRIIHLPKWVVGLSAACVMLFCANCISVSAWNMNIVSAVVKFTKGGFSVNFEESESDIDIIELPISEDDPYGLIAECAKYDIYPETPYYLPEGFKLTNIICNVNETSSNSIGFTFTKGEQSISIDYEKYWYEIGNFVVPSDNYSISETEVNGHSAIVSKEDEQYTITFMNDKTSFMMFTQDVPYEECEKIVNSIK